MPPNFSKIVLKENVNVKLVDLWIYQNLDSRYCILKTTGIDDQNKMVTRFEVGIEEPKELTMFSLGCPHLHKQEIMMADEQEAPKGPELTVTDLQNLRAIIDIAATRGAFKASEMAGVGTVFNKLDKFLAAVVPAQAAEQAAQAQG